MLSARPTNLKKPVYTQPYGERGPFNREMWLARTTDRRMQEWQDRNALSILRVSPRMHKVKDPKDLSYRDYVEAVRAFTVGGDTYAMWCTKYKPQSPMSSRLSTPLVSPRATVPALTKQLTAAQILEKQKESQGIKKGMQVDHALEVFRQREGAGAYLFDGDVAAIGAGEAQGPITDAELEAAHDIIRGRMSQKFGTFRKAFREIDHDRDGKITEYEFLRVLMMFNLTGIREKVVQRLAKICDRDGDGVEFDEFVELMLAEDALPLLKAAGHVQSGGIASPRGSGTLSPRAPSTPRSTGSRVGTPRTQQRAFMSKGHVDHALEAFRQNSASGGYQFDGTVDAIASGPVSDQELEAAHDIIRAKITQKFGTFRRAFQAIDEDRSGKISEYEFLRVLMMFNLVGIREPVIKKLARICDKDGDGIEYDEFVELVLSEDALPLLKAAGHVAG